MRQTDDIDASNPSSYAAEENEVGSSRKSKSRRRGRGVRLREGSRIREPGNDAETEPLAAENGQKSTLLGLSSAFNIVRKVSDKMANKKQEHPLKRRASRRARAGSVRRTGSRNRRQGSVRSGSRTPSVAGGGGPDRSSSASRRPNGQLGRERRARQTSETQKSSDVESGEVSDTTKTKPTQKTDYFYTLLQTGWKQFQIMIGARHEEVITVQEIIKAEPIYEDLDLPHRYRPENLQLLCDATGFSVVEMKRIYRGFKTECPTGLITEEAFHGIYSRFFPQGAHFIWRDANAKVRSSVKPHNVKMSKKERKEVQNSQANISSYSHYVFSTLDHEDSGIITFEDFVIGLSILVRGTLEEKVRWMFTLYDQDRDGYISREEMEDVVGSVFDLMGRTSDPILEEEVINERVDHLFERMDLNGDGVVSFDEFLETCMGDEHITRSIIQFSTVVV